LTRKFSILLGLVLALALTACGAVPADAWPTLVTDGQRAYVAFSAHVYAVDLSNGKQVWTFPVTTASDSGGFFSFLSSSPSVPNGSANNFYAEPALADDVLIVSGVRPGSSHSGVVFGLDLATGEARWCVAFDDKGAAAENPDSLSCQTPNGSAARGFLGVAPPIDNRIIGGVTLEDGILYWGLASGSVYAMDAAEGVFQWSEAFRAEDAVWAAPQVDGEAVYVTSLGHFVYAIDRATGAEKWKQDLGAAIGGGAVAADGLVYVGTFGNKFYALDAATGQERWSLPTNNWVWSTPVLRNGVVYFTDLAGGVFAVDAATGAPKWTATPGGPLRAAPAVTDDTLYVGDKIGKLFALDLSNGALRWTKDDIKGQLLTTPVVVGDVVLVTPFEGDNLLAAYTTSGAFKWGFAPSR